MVSFKFIVLAVFLGQYGQATRYLPMVVWDHFNPLLTCRCNWLTIPKVDIYDRIRFVCPTEHVQAALFKDRNRPRNRMYESLYRRKWNIKEHPLEELKNAINDDTLCDPKSNGTKKLYDCQNGIVGSSYEFRFNRDSNLKAGDFLVFFNNAQDGRQSSLNSVAGKCTMVFAVNVTWLLGEQHDMSYGKCLFPKDHQCSSLNVNCRSVCNPPAPCPSKTTSSTVSSPYNSSSPPPETTSTTLTTVQPSINQSVNTKRASSLTNDITSSATSPTTIGCNATASASGGSGTDKSFLMVALVAFVIGLVGGSCSTGVACLLCRKKAKQCRITRSSDKKNKATTVEQGYHNEAFKIPSAPMHQPSEASQYRKFSKDADGLKQAMLPSDYPHGNRLPSVEISEKSRRSLPPLQGAKRDSNGLADIHYPAQYCTPDEVDRGERKASLSKNGVLHKI